MVPMLAVVIEFNIISLHFGMVTTGRHVTKVFSMTMNRDDLSRNFISEALESTNRRVLMRSTEWYCCPPVWLTLKVISLHFGMVTVGDKSLLNDNKSRWSQSEFHFRSSRVNQSTRLDEIYRMVLTLTSMVDFEGHFASFCCSSLKSDMSRSTLPHDFPWSKVIARTWHLSHSTGNFMRFVGKLGGAKMNLRILSYRQNIKKS